MESKRCSLLESYINNPDKYVFPFVIKEKHKSRTIITYNKGEDYGQRLRNEHSRLLEQFRMNFAQRNEHSFAYHKNVRCLDAVEDHLQSHHFIKLDIHHFFESITEELFFKVYGDYFNDNWKNILKGCFYKGSLSIGFVTSPAISDFFMRYFDRNIEKYLSDHGELHYSRYSDDMLLSSDAETSDSLEEFFKFVQEELAKLSLDINESKTKRVTLDYEKHNSLTFLGLNISKKNDIDNKVTISKKYILFLLMLIEKNRKWKYSCRELINEINSRVAYLAYNSPVSYERFQKKHQNIYGVPYYFVPKKPFERTAPIKAIDIPNFEEDSKIFKFNIHKNVKGKGGIGVNDAVELVSYIAETKYNKVVIPSYVNSIATNAFKGHSEIEEIVLNEKLKVIEEQAFADCTGLKAINLPESLRFIGEFAFKGCTSLKEIVIPSKIKAIYANTFYATGLEKVVLGEKVAEINSSAFALCINLKDIIFNSNLKVIKDSAFMGCEKLEKLDLSNTNVEIIGESAFSKNYSLNEIKLPVTLLNLGNTSFASCISLASIYIPQYLVDIGTNAFHGCHNLSSIIVDENNLVYACSQNHNAIIEKNTSKLIYALKDYTIEDGIKIIGTSAFAGTYITKLTLPSSLQIIEQSSFENCVWLKEVIIPEAVSMIYPNAFLGCTSLETINIPKAVKKLADGIFKGCLNLVNLQLHNGIIAIGNEAFADCAKLNISIPESVKSIGYKAFKDCHSIKNLVIPQATNKINQNAFYGLAKSVETISVHHLNAVYSSGDNCNLIIERKNGLVILGCKNSVLNTEVNKIGSYAFAWCSELEKIKLPYTVKDIEKGAFKECVSLASVNLGNVYTIAEEAFAHNRLLKSIELPESLVTIGDSAFKGTALQTVCLPSSISKYGMNLFDGCMNLEKISIPSTFNAYSIGMFGYCPNINSIEVNSANPKYDSRDNCNAIIETKMNILVLGCCETIIPNEVDIIDDCAFSHIKGLKKITIPDKITMIGNLVFESCEDLEEVKWNSGAPITTGCFKNCRKLVNVSISDNVKDIQFQAFAGCKSLEEIDLSKTKITSIAGLTFMNNSSLKKILLPETISSIGFDAFNSCSSLEEINLPNSVKTIGKTAFMGCSKLNNITLPESLTSIQECAFYGTQIKEIFIPKNVSTLSSTSFKGLDLEKIIVDKANEYFLDEGCNVITYIDPIDKTKHLLLGCKNSIIPNDVVFIDESAFANVSGLVSVEIPESVEVISACAFEDCSDLKTVKFPTHLSMIGANCFAGCTALEEINITRVETEDDKIALHIYSYAFSRCQSLRKVSINGKNISIDNAFSSYAHLEEIDINVSNLQSDSSKKVLVDKNNRKLLLATSNALIPNDILSIESNAFNYTTNDKVVIPHGVVTIKDSFMSCGTILEFVIPSTLKSLSQSAFIHTDIKKFTVDKDCVLYHTNTEGSILFSSIDDKAIYICGDGYIEEGIRNIGAYALTKKGLKHLYIPSTLTHINLSSITTSELESIEVSIDNPVYYSQDNCLLLKSNDTLVLGCKESKIPEHVRRIADYAFYNCKSLENVYIGKNITFIGKNAFNKENNIKSIIVDCENPIFDSRNNCNAIILIELNLPVLTCKESKLEGEMLSIGKTNLPFVYNRCCSVTPKKYNSDNTDEEVEEAPRGNFYFGFDDLPF